MLRMRHISKLSQLLSTYQASVDAAVGLPPFISAAAAAVLSQTPAQQQAPGSLCCSCWPEQGRRQLEMFQHECLQLTGMDCCIAQQAPAAAAGSAGVSTARAAGGAQLQQPWPLQCVQLPQQLQQQQQQQHLWLAGQPWQQLQQCRGLLGVARHKNYQDHNKQKPKKIKIKTPPIARRRVVVGADGTMWRMQAGRRHKRYKKNRRRLLGLKGLVPLHSADAAKLKKLGFNKKWWYHLKA